MRIIDAKALGLALGLLGLGCGGEDKAADEPGGAPRGCDFSAEPSRTIACVDAFTPGKGAGFGQESFPEIVYGEPLGGGTTSGSVDVLSLGSGGEIVVGFGGNAIVDAPGPDFLIFENAFFVGGNPELVFAEPAEVAVSADGEAWFTFPCASEEKPPKGCAGLGPVNANADVGVSAFDPAVAGGDAFDLATVGLAEARLIRIRDLGLGPAAPPTGGFDLDAAAILHAKVP